MFRTKSATGIDFRAFGRRTLIAGLAIVYALQGSSFGQDKDENKTRSRPLAPGILTVIPPDPEVAETTTVPKALVEVVKARADLKFDPKYTARTRTVFDRAQKVYLRREIWTLEFAFKPMRMINVDVPMSNGKFKKKKIWYMVYRLRYLGRELHPEAKTDNFGKTTFDTKKADYTNRWFFPSFVLQAHKLNKSYHDQIIPSAIKLIEEREMQGQKLLNNIEVTKQRIMLSTPQIDRPIWAVTTWEDIDPTTDYFSVYVQGLTNAYKYIDNPDFTVGDEAGKGRKLLTKTLRLNFFRYGDSVGEDEKEIIYGLPAYQSEAAQAKILQIYGLQKRLDHLWLYR